MNLTDVLGVLRRRWATVAGGLLLGLLVAGLALWLLPKTYESSTSLYVTATDDSDASALSQGATYVQNQIRSYPMLVTSPSVMQAVAAETGLGTPGELAGQVTAQVPTDSAILAISATGEDPQSAAVLASSVARHFGTEIIELEKRPGQEASPVRLTVVQPASPPDQAAEPSASILLVLGAAGGLLVGFILAIVRESTARR